jgi:hypothetical protein
MNRCGEPAGRAVAAAKERELRNTGVKIVSPRRAQG